MKPELMKNWFVVQNGAQIDIHVRDKAEDREITVVAGVRDDRCANLIANAPKYLAALEKILSVSSLADNESNEHKERVSAIAADALGLSNTRHETQNQFIGNTSANP